jgi:hypothetical protein
MTTPKDEKGAEPALIALETGPFAYWVYIAAERRGEFVHHLDDAIDDLTNCECTVTPLYEAAPPTSGLDSAREALERIIGMCGEVDRCACGRPTGIPALVSCARRALSDMKGKPSHYGPGSGERPQGGVPVQDGG